VAATEEEEEDEDEEDPNLGRRGGKPATNRLSCGAA
jgi:hypothetical protein